MRIRDARGLFQCAIVMAGALLTLSMGPPASATAIDITFDGLSANTPLDDQYGAEGVWFRDAMSLSGASPAVVVDGGFLGWRWLQPNHYANPIFVLLSNPVSSFAVWKFEPSGAQPPQEDAPPQEQPAQEDQPPQEDTVYLEFFLGPDSIGTLSDHNRGSWGLVTFASATGFDTIKIVGDQPYILDNLRFEAASSNAVPEPSTVLLLAGGVAALAWVHRRRRGAGSET